MKQYQAFVFQQLHNTSERINENEPTVLIPIGIKCISYQEAEDYVLSVVDWGVDYTILCIKTK